MKAVSAEIQFNAAVYILNTQTILRLPEDESEKLPSRGQVSVRAIINGYEFSTVLEPDGYWGHWMRITEEIQNKADIKAGDTVTVELIVVKEWPEPLVPKDVDTALKAAPEKVKEKWKDITPMARWEWIRWVNSTGNNDTRAIRIEKTISKLNGTHRRPCCFNLAACTDPELSKSGRLIQV